MKILVTGGQGFIGSYIVDNLIGRGHRVAIFDRSLNRGLWQEYEWENHVDFTLGDLKDAEAVEAAVSLCDRWINLAGLLGTSEMVDNPAPAVAVNIAGALNVFEAARAHGKPGLQIAVGNHWMNNPYSITKSCAERFAQMYRDEHGVDIRVVRAMNVYGPRQKHRPVRKIFPNVAIPALLGEEITIYGDGHQVMDMVYAPDAAEIIARVLLADDLPPVIFEAGAGPLTINELVHAVLRAAESKAPVRHVPMRAGEEEGAVVKISDQGWRDLREHLGYTPDDLTPFERAVRASVNWYRDNLERFPWSS